MNTYEAIDLGSSFLEHHGVKGMKWGIRKQRTNSDGSRRLSRREFRQSEKQRRQEVNVRRANAIIEFAQKKPSENLIVARMGPTAQQTIATGNDFIKHLSRGGAFDVETARIYRADKKTKEYVQVKLETFEKGKRKY